jgi:hypothetical protein
MHKERKTEGMGKKSQLCASRPKGEESRRDLIAACHFIVSRLTVVKVKFFGRYFQPGTPLLQSKPLQRISKHRIGFLPIKSAASYFRECTAALSIASPSL